MTVVRRALGWIAELALESFVVGVAMQAGESAVTEAIKAAKKARKRRRRAAETDDPQGAHRG
jgi:hypothetical protein